MSNAYQAYTEQKNKYEQLEQQVKQCQDSRLLPALNLLLENAAIAVEAAFLAWCNEVDAVIQSADSLPTPGVRIINGWAHDSSDGRTLLIG